MAILLSRPIPIPSRAEMMKDQLEIPQVRAWEEALDRGEIEHPSLFDMRDAFLRAVERYAWRALEQLEGKPDEYYGKLYWHNYPFVMAPEPWGQLERLLRGCHPDAWDQLAIWEYLSPTLRPLRESLLEWGRRYRLEDGWCFERALALLFCETTYPKEWYYHTRPPIPTEEEEVSRLLEIEIPAWDYRHESWSEAKKRIVAEFTQQLEQHHRETIDATKLAGLNLPPRQITVRHFTWLARFQVEQDSYTDIANHDQVDLKTVRGAIDVAAKAIGLSLRTAKRTGRIPGRRSSKYSAHARRRDW